MQQPRRILKWPVRVDDTAHPIGHGPVVRVATQGDSTTVWVWTDETGTDIAPSRPTQIYGTGQPVPPDAIHLGSCETDLGLVWHAFAL
jgi:hypothetical protein